MSRISNIPVFNFQFWLLMSSSVYAVNPTVPGMVDVHATLHSIGIEWAITGDNNHNATCTVQYRIYGNSQWKTALPLYRFDFNNANTLAGSLFFLEPATQYEVKLNLLDSDGGSDQKTISISTRAIAQKQKWTNFSCRTRKWWWFR